VPREDAVRHVTLSKTVTSDYCGTTWLKIYDGCRYFDVRIGGIWHGRVTLEVRKSEDPRKAVMCLGAFDGNILDLFYLDSDSEARLWVRMSDLEDGEMTLEIGN
jgi:hypothetical protein